MACIAGIGSWLAWYCGLAFVGRKVRTLGRRWPLVLAPVVCAGLLYGVLAWWSAEDVRTDPAYMTFYMVVGLGWLGAIRWLLPLVGLGLRDEVLERGNDAAGWAISGALVGLMCCFAGGNVGNGPGWWVVLFSGLISTVTLLVLWWVVHAGSGLPEKVTLDRDSAAGLRAAGFLVGSGLILGRAVAGDWVSAGATVVDFLRMAWPAAVLTGAAVLIERSCAPLPRGPLGVYVQGGVPALGYAAAGIVVMLAW